MDDPQVVELVATIERTIVEHGFYILKNRLLGLVCGVDSAMSLDDPWTTELVQAFATKMTGPRRSETEPFVFIREPGAFKTLSPWL
jgi:hypothetical protein